VPQFVAATFILIGRFASLAVIGYSDFKTGIVGNFDEGTYMCQKK
jgi:hypothetical protein